MKIGATTEHLILFDIDGTLLYRNGCNAADYAVLARAIKLFKKKDMIFGINTNRPWINARQIYTRLGLNGPIIAENGAYYKLSATGKKYLINKKVLPLRQNIIRITKKWIHNVGLKDTLVVVSDDKRILKNTRSLNGVILISRSRDYTGSIYFRFAGKANKKYIKDFGIYLVQRLRRNKINVTIKLIEGSKIIVSQVAAYRLETAALMQKKYYPRRQIMMISDEESNVSVYRKSMVFAAVGNAEKNYYQHSAVTSRISGARGVIDILKKYFS